MKKDKPSNGVDVKEKIYRSIRMDIISHKLRPGQSIIEEELASQYNVSRTPIREILRKLEREDLIKIIPHKGIFVYELTNKDMEEVLEIRLILESTAARLAAEKISDDKLKELDQIESLMDKAVKDQDSVLSFEADEKLHDFILVNAGNMRMRKILHDLMGQILRIRFISGHKPGRIITTVDEHKKIINAIKNKDPHNAEEKMRIHLLNTKELLLPPQDMDDKFQKILESLRYGD
jgi:DNA-binding GntR family transcriptional regulator